MYYINFKNTFFNIECNLFKTLWRNETMLADAADEVVKNLNGNLVVKF